MRFLDTIDGVSKIGTTIRRVRQRVCVRVNLRSFQHPQWATPDGLFAIDANVTCPHMQVPVLFISSVV